MRLAKPIFVLGGLGFITVLTTVAVTWLLVLRLTTGDTVKPVSLFSNPQAAEGGGLDPTSQPPKQLQRLKEDHDNELKLAHLALANSASSFLESLAGFEDEIAEWGQAFDHYIRVSPHVAALGQQMAAPAEVSLSNNSSNIRSGVRLFHQAKREYDLEVKRIQFAYLRDLGVVTVSDSPDQKREVMNPKTEFEEDVLFALWLADRVDSVFQSYQGLIDSYRAAAFRERPNSPAGVLAPLHTEFHKSRGRADDATEQEKQRASAILTLEEVNGRLVPYRSDTSAKFVRDLLTKLDELINNARTSLDQGDFETSIERGVQARDLLERIIREGQARAELATAKNEYEEVVRQITEPILREDGGEAWDGVQELVTELRRTDDLKEQTRLYREATEILKANKSRIVLAGVRTAEKKGAISKGFSTLDEFIEVERGDERARQEFNRLSTAHPEFFVALAETESKLIRDQGDRALALMLISNAYGKLGCYEEQKRVASELLTVFSGLDPRYLGKHITSESFRYYLISLCIVRGLIEGGEGRHAALVIQEWLSQVKTRELLMKSRNGTFETYWFFNHAVNAAAMSGLAKQLGDKNLEEAAWNAAIDASGHVTHSLISGQQLWESQNILQRSNEEKRIWIRSEAVDRLAPVLLCVSKAFAGEPESALAIARDTPTGDTWIYLCIAAALDEQCYKRFADIKNSFSGWVPVYGRSKQTQCLSSLFKGLFPQNYHKKAAAIVEYVDRQKQDVRKAPDKELFDLRYRNFGAIYEEQENYSKGGRAGLFMCTEVDATRKRITPGSSFRSLWKEAGSWKATRRNAASSRRTARYIGLGLAALEQRVALAQAE